MTDTKLGFPVFQLKGGRYDGHTTVIRDDAGARIGPVASVAFFPTELHVWGDDGLQTYRVQDEGTAVAFGPGS